MFDKLNLTEIRYEEINQKLMDPNIMSDNNIYKSLMKEYKNLSPLIEKYREYKIAKKSFDEAKELLDLGGLEKDFKEIVLEEYEKNRDLISSYKDDIKVLLLPTDPNDDKNVIVEIRGGAGGDEASLFAYNLYRMYTMYAEIKGWKSEILNVNETEVKGFKEVSFSISGDGAYSRFKFEMGVHRVQRVPETESSGRIHTSTVTIAILPEAEEVEVDINTSDLQIDTFRAGGAGGQHVNKTESAIRITHIPTGTVVECQDERSQHKNKDKAMKIIRSRIYEAKMREQHDIISSDRKSQVGTGDRSERIRTYNYPQGRMTDHRIGLTLYKLEDILNGNIEDIIDALITADQAEKLASSEENF